MMTEINDFFYAQSPTAMRPLLGVTILLVEDSLTVCEAMRLMCLRSGARLRRADCLESARRHLKAYRPSIVITDMGLPDGSGAELISELKQSKTSIEIVLGLSADDTHRDAAMSAGADGFLEKPIQSIAAFQAAILPYLPKERQPTGPRKVQTDQIPADGIALQEDLSHALNLLEDGENTPATHRYLSVFLSGVARTASDAELQAAADAFSNARAKSNLQKNNPEREKLTAILNKRLAHQISI